MEKYKNLLSPIKIAGITARNRIECTPTSFMDGNTEGFLNDSAIDMYRSYAKGGAAIVTLGESYVDDERGIPHPSGLPMYNKNVLPYLIRATEAIRQHGAIASIEFLHPGQRIDIDLNKGRKAYGPSAEESIFAYDHPVYELTEEMILDIIQRYGDAAELAQDGGVEMIMIYAAHGWLISQFLSPLTNHRTDCWGGSIENRCRLPLLIAKEIKKRCGKDFPVEFRVSAAEHIPGGYTIEDTIAMCRYLEGFVDLINVSNGSFASKASAKLTIGSSIFVPRAGNVKEAKIIKENINIPVSVVGGLGSPDQMEEIIRSGSADLVAMARSLIADPEMPNKVARKAPERIRPCVRCNYCFSHNYIPLTPYAKKLPRCAVNPLFGRDKQYQDAMALSFLPRKKILIAGGGPAGMQAAITASELGHSVILYEKERRLGGLLRYAVHASFKTDLLCYQNWLINTVENDPNIDIHLGCELTPALADKIKPDILIVAIGSDVITTLPIKGIDQKNVLSLVQIAEENQKIGKSIAIIGGGLSGCEEALDLARAGKKVFIIETLERLLSTLNYDFYLHKKDLLDEIEKMQNISVFVNSNVIDINGDRVSIRNHSGAETEIEVDNVIVSCGTRSRSDAANEFRTSEYKYVLVGDCKKARNIAAATEEGFLAVLDLQ